MLAEFRCRKCETPQVHRITYIHRTERSENQLTTAKNAGANYIRIGDKWINLRWTGPLSLPIAGIMSGRQNKAQGEMFMVGYAKGVLSGILEFPVIKEFYGAIDGLVRASKSGTINNFLNNLGLDLESIRRWTQVRVVPSIISHDIQGLFNETRYDFMGRPIPEKTFKNFIIGANIKEDTSNAITEEFNRLKSNLSNLY